MSCCGSIIGVASAPEPEPPVPVALGASSTAVANDTIAKPAGVVTGSILVAAVGGDAATTPPVGWVNYGSAKFDNIFAGYNWQTDIFVKVVTDGGSEPATYTFTGASYTDIWMVALDNVDPFTPVADTTSEPVLPATDVGTVSNGASCVVGRDGSMLLRFEASNAENRLTGPAGMTALAGSPIDTTFNADFEAVNSGATGDRDSTYTNPQTWTVHMIVLQPLP